MEGKLSKRHLIDSIAAEYRRYKALGDSSLEQVPDDQLSQPGPGGGNSLAIICWHLAGNLQSRFTDFLTTDGEKPWRQREEEFAQRSVSRNELLEKWNEGWKVLLSALDDLTDADLDKTVTIRGQPLAVHEALHRSLAHASYHVGQIVYLVHSIAGNTWKYLSIPPGGSQAYNAAPTMEKAASHSERLTEKQRG